jgi:hypothetical protein
MKDEKGNAGYDKKGINETAQLTPLWGYRVPSASYSEGDGGRRPKPMLVDDDGSLWLAWQANDGVKLHHLGNDDVDSTSLGVGQGMSAREIWGKLSLAQSGGKRRLAFYTGFAAPRNGSTRQSPRGPAEVAVFNPEDKSVWTYDISGNHDNLRPNGHWTHLDRSHMVVTRRWIHVAWVDATQGNAKLRIVSLDAFANNSDPVETDIDLEFPSSGNKDSTLVDLIASEGKMFAYIFQADQFEIDSDEPTLKFSAQHVVALSNP